MSYQRLSMTKTRPLGPVSQLGDNCPTCIGKVYSWSLCPTPRHCMVDRGFRFHDNLIYGRRGDADEGEGIAIIKACSFSWYINAGRILQSMLPTGNHRVRGGHIRPDYVPLPDTLRVKTPIPMFGALERNAWPSHGRGNQRNQRNCSAWPSLASDHVTNWLRNRTSLGERVPSPSCRHSANNMVNPSALRNALACCCRCTFTRTCALRPVRSSIGTRARAWLHRLHVNASALQSKCYESCKTNGANFARRLCTLSDSVPWVELRPTQPRQGKLSFAQR